MRTATILCALFLAVYLVIPAKDSASATLQVVQQFEQAFNEHDVEAMAALVAEDFRYFYVVGDSLVAQASSREELRKSMQGYFKGLPSARSEIEEYTVAGSFISVRERAYWNANGKERSQFSLGVYEVRDGLIRRVWYYPAER